MREAEAWECFLLWERANLSNEITQLSQPAKPALLPKSSYAGLAALFSISCPIWVIHVNSPQTTFDTCFSSQKLVEKGQRRTLCKQFFFFFLCTYSIHSCERQYLVPQLWAVTSTNLWQSSLKMPLSPPAGGKYLFFLISICKMIDQSCLFEDKASDGKSAWVIVQLKIATAQPLHHSPQSSW